MCYQQPSHLIASSRLVCRIIHSISGCIPSSVAWKSLKLVYAFTGQHQRGCCRGCPGRGWGGRSSERAGQWQSRPQRSCRRRWESPELWKFKVSNCFQRLTLLGATYADRSRGWQGRGHQSHSTGLSRRGRCKERRPGESR